MSRPGRVGQAGPLHCRGGCPAGIPASDASPEARRGGGCGDRLEGIEGIAVPGGRGQRRAAELTRSGRVPLNAVAWSTLADVCGPLGVPLPT